MGEREIQKQYIELDDKEVKLYGAYTTRPQGFIDILLSRMVLCSEEAHDLLGKVSTHRGNSMSDDDEIEDPYARNPYISLSSGFVSFKYSDASVRKFADYQGGFGVFVPLEKLLQFDPVHFSHCSHLGGVEDYSRGLSRENIVSYVHKVRKEGKLRDDGYGNVFEVLLYAEGQYRQWTRFPKIDLEDKEIVVAIPESEKGFIHEEIEKRQKFYQKFLEALRDPEIRERGWNIFDDTNIFYPDKTEELLTRMLEPFDEDRMNILWYDQKNLDIALQYLSISS